jgi:group I intron endonuclease
MYYIYTVTNTKNNKVYVGFTKNPVSRWRTHRTKFGSGSTNKVLYLAIRKYGIETFEFKIIYSSDNKQHTKNIMESHYIDSFGSMVPNGYNMTNGGDGGPGVTSDFASANNLRRVAAGTHTFLQEEFRKKVSQRMKIKNPANGPSKIDRIAVMTKTMRDKCARPILIEVKCLHKQLKLPISRALHTRSTEQLEDLKDHLEQQIANL